MGLGGGKPVLGIPPLSAHKQNKEIPLSAVTALFIVNGKPHTWSKKSAALADGDC